MNVSGMFSDDQMAIIGCFAALAVCGMIAALSFHFGPAGREQKQIAGTRKHSLPLQKLQDQSQQDRGCGAGPSSGSADFGVSLVNDGGGTPDNRRKRATEFDGGPHRHLRQLRVSLILIPPDWRDMECL
jgi:hypothetical protein